MLGRLATGILGAALVAALFVAPGCDSGGPTPAADASSGGLGGEGGSRGAELGGTPVGGSEVLGGTGTTDPGGVSAGQSGSVAFGGDAGRGADDESAGRGGAPGAGGNGAAAGDDLGPLLTPAQGALLGAHVGTGTLAELEATLGRKLAVVHKFYAWRDNWPSWVATTLQGGQIPLVTWEPWTGGVGIPLDEILGGTHDAMLRERARAAKAVAARFFLRWGHEMNGNWYPWDGFHNGKNAAAVAKYVAAYRHLHDLFTAEGASNVIWVFCPNFESVPRDDWNKWTGYYPGDAYVDWMAFDGYNRGTSEDGSTWRSFATVTGLIYPGLAAKGKPIMIAETASTEDGGDKAAWIKAILPALRSSFPAIKALIWFHTIKSTDWRVDSSAASRAAFVPLANDPYFNP